jgi:hypothetical protein
VVAQNHQRHTLIEALNIADDESELQNRWDDVEYVGNQLARWNTGIFTVEMLDALIEGRDMLAQWLEAFADDGDIEEVRHKRRCLANLDRMVQRLKEAPL